MENAPHWGLIGHEWAVQLLREHVASGQVRPAYLFTGPRGVGRRTLALRLAQAINCEQPSAPGEPCRACRACTHLEAMQHPDLHIVQAEREGGFLKVDQIRELQRGLSLHPYEAKKRIALLLRFEEARRDEAANILLKTLEEPPALVTLLLTAESPERLLPTIVSRCEVLRLRPAPLPAVAGALESQWGLEPERARLLAHISAGRPGYALRLSQDAALLEQRSTQLARTRLGRLALCLPAHQRLDQTHGVPGVQRRLALQPLSRYCQVLGIQLSRGRLGAFRQLLAGVFQLFGQRGICFLLQGAVDRPEVLHHVVAVVVIVGVCFVQRNLVLLQGFGYLVE